MILRAGMWMDGWMDGRTEGSGVWMNGSTHE